MDLLSEPDSGELIPLTRNEFDILAALSSRPGVVWSRGQLIDAVWVSRGWATTTSSTSTSDICDTNSPMTM